MATSAPGMPVWPRHKAPLLSHLRGGRPGVAVYWPTADDSDPHRNAVLALAASVLRHRLHERLREQEGASYAPSAGNQPSHFFAGFGYFVAAVDASTDETERLFSLIDEVVTSMTTGVSEDELERARAPRLERFRMSLEDNLSWMEAVSVAQSEPQTARAWLERPGNYRAVTTEDIVTAAKSYLRSDAAVKVLVLPQSRP